MAIIFFSYSHDDEALRDQLEKHFASMRHQGLVEMWHDRRIQAGDTFGEVIDAHLDEADVILLLVSASFLDSGYCYGVEMQRALERHASGQAKVVPIILRPCDWKTTPLGQLLALPRDGKAITTWANSDEAYTDVAYEVRKLVEEQQRRLSTSTRMAPVLSRGRPQPASPNPPRSSNMRLREEFTDADKDQFAHDAFEFISRFFEESLRELQSRHPRIEGRFRRVDANTITAFIYRDGRSVSECAIHMGGASRHREITFSLDAAARGGSYNESLSVVHDDQALYLRALGMAIRTPNREKLSVEHAADYLWALLLERLQ